jgi:hypothetical protein
MNSMIFYINCDRTRQNSKKKAGWIAKGKITRKRGKLINENLHSEWIEVRWKNRKEEKYLFPIYTSKHIANNLPIIN